MFVSFFCLDLSLGHVTRRMNGTLVLGEKEMTSETRVPLVCVSLDFAPYGSSKVLDCH